MTPLPPPDKYYKDAMSLSHWYLEGFQSNSRQLLRIALHTLPFSVGRRASCDLALNSPLVSQVHAEFFNRDTELWLRDRDSTNGTFINGRRVTAEHVLRTGDIVHFGDLEFRIQEHDSQPATDMLSETLRKVDGGIHGAKFRELREMLQSRSVQALFQPLISLEDSTLLGYELLGRGLLDGASTAPEDLFVMAETIGVAPELSALFRARGIDEAARLPEALEIFVNTHPEELLDHENLLTSLHTLRERHPKRAIVLEVHESAVTEPASLKQLSRHLDELDVGVAFDDFGTGQARLLELTDAAPRYIKFDVSLIRNLHRGAKKRRDMVETLVRLVTDMDIVPIAEGIEVAEEARVCAELGFQYGQGFYFGHPTLLDNFVDK